MPERERVITLFPRGPARIFSLVVLVVMLMGLAYLAMLSFTSLLHPYRFAIPYAVPIFDTPFVLVASDYTVALLSQGLSSTSVESSRAPGQGPDLHRVDPLGSFWPQDLDP